MVSGRPEKDALFEAIALMGKAFASPRRLELLDLLAQAPRTVEALAREIGRSTAATSHHLQVLRRARLVEADKDGLYVTCRLGGPEVGAFLLTLRTLAEWRLAEVARITREYLESRDALEPVSQAELVRRVRAGEVTLVDVRPPEEYAAAHIPGAISMPVAELPRRVGELGRRRGVVAYCRGPYCVMAVDAVAILRRKGVRAWRLEDGVPEWRARGWRIQQPRDGVPA
jgi:rhodanese-related sulfurtransferase/DNA-binding transcriptional ArsR family regulator